MKQFILAASVVALLAVPITTLSDVQGLDNKQATETHCLATIIHKESRGEGLLGQKAVASVVLNRAERSGKPICKIMAEPSQFSWYKAKARLLSNNEIDSSLALASAIIDDYNNGEHVDVTKGSTHFAGKQVVNVWTRKFKRMLAVGGHVFYRGDYR